MIYVIQVFCLLIALVCIGQTVKAAASKFDKITFSIFCVLFVLITVGMWVAQR